MKVVYFLPDSEQSSHLTSLPPLGVGYVAAYSARECPDLEQEFHRSLDKALSAKPDVLAISAVTEHIPSAAKAGRRARDELGIPVVLGGPHISTLPQSLPETIDIGVVGEGEATFVELVRLFARGKPRPEQLRQVQGICFHNEGGVEVTPMRPGFTNLDELPYPDRDLLRYNWVVPPGHQLHMISSRGCPYRCRFCVTSGQWKRYTAFSARYVVDEIEYLVDRHRPYEITFLDTLIMGDLGRLEELCRLLRERGLHKTVGFRILGRTTHITPEIVDVLAATNVHDVDLGVESNSRKVLEYLRKDGASPEMNQKAVDLLTAAGITVGAGIVCGTPVETREDVWETVRFLEA